MPRSSNRVRGAAVWALVLCVSAALSIHSQQPGFADSDAADTDVSEHVVELAFATNRNRSQPSDPQEYYDAGEDTLSFGTCTVEFSPIDLLKNAAQHIPIRFPTELENIIDIQPTEPDAFWSDLARTVDAAGQRLVLYIHGYKMDFAKSCRRAALLQRELGPELKVLLFAWPSRDNFAKYTQDETALKKSVVDIGVVLRRMVAELGPGRSHVVAHSLGTRGVTSAISALGGQDRFLLDELVLIAPDMDRQDFEAYLPNLAIAASAITIYVSDNDSPLRISREVHGEPRIGEAGEFLTLFDGVETIDISAAPQRDIYGHNYHYFNERVIADLRHLLNAHQRAATRPGLKQAAQGELIYWQMTDSM